MAINTQHITMMREIPVAQIEDQTLGAIHFDAVKKMQKKPMPRIIAGCAFAVILTVNFLSLRLSSIVLMLVAGAVGILVFAAKRKAGGAK